MRKLRSVAAIAAVSVLALAGCSSSKTEEEVVEVQSGQSGAAAGEPVTLVVAASPSPHAQILEFVRDNLAEDAGLQLEIKEFTDYVQPNEALDAGDVDVNYFQTKPYLETESEARGYDFVAGEGIHLEPLAIYSDKYTDLKDVPEGAKVGIINDTTNQQRALELLAREGFVELPADGEDINVNTVTPLHGITFQEQEGAQLPRSLQDTDISVINGNYAASADLSTDDALAVEEVDGNPSLNLLAWQKGSPKEAEILKLQDLLRSDATREYIENTWPNGDVLPAF